MSAVPRSGPPGRSAPTRAAIISRSSSTIRASWLRSTPTWSRMANPLPSSGPAPVSRAGTEQHHPIAPPGSQGGASSVSRQRLPAVLGGARREPPRPSFGSDWIAVHGLDPDVVARWATPYAPPTSNLAAQVGNLLHHAHWER